MNAPLTANPKCAQCGGTGAVLVCCRRPEVGAEYMGAQEMFCCGNPEMGYCECMFADNPPVRREDIV